MNNPVIAKIHELASDRYGHDRLIVDDVSSPVPLDSSTYRFDLMNEGAAVETVIVRGSEADILHLMMEIHEELNKTK